MKELNTIQVKLNAPKNQYNSFGKYHYRNCEDILEAIKPLLKETECTLVISDDIILIGDRYYVKATATITNSKDESVSNTAWAREASDKKGMDEAQITGATSSYARKYALNGLFCIDDNKDTDATNIGGGNSAEEVLKTMKKCKTFEELQNLWNQYGPVYGNDKRFVTEVNKLWAKYQTR